VGNALHAVNRSPLARLYASDVDPVGAASEFPYVALTYRLTEHFHFWTKHVASSSQLQSNFFVEVPEELAREKGIESGDRVRVRSARGQIEGLALVTRRLKGLRVQGRTVYQIGLPLHWGFVGRVTGPLVNNLTLSVVDPNSGTPEFKGFLVNLEKV
jgi:formate dehydrogenase major subunit